MEPTKTPATKKTPIIFVDMDGVLSDFVNGALKLLHAEGFTHHSPEQALRIWKRAYLGEWDICKIAGCNESDLWRSIHAAGSTFWRDLAETPLYGKLTPLLMELELANQAQTMIATSPSSNQSSYAGKAQWLIERGFKPHENAMLGSQKHLLAAPGRILIDDNDTNCQLFRKHGGYAILVPQVWNSFHSVAAQGPEAQWHTIETKINACIKEAARDIQNP